MACPIEHYALIGDCETAALVGRTGSIDWLCWPRFDSSACFAALVGTSNNGRWLLTAADPQARIARGYRDRTLILETSIETPDGAATIVDFMPPRGDASHVVRLVCGKRGRVVMRTEFLIRFDYGSLAPWVIHMEDRSLRAIAGPDLVVLRTPVPLLNHDFKSEASFTVSAGETVPFVLTYGASHLPLPRRIDPLKALAETEAFWRHWANQAKPAGDWSDAVMRSLITLKALTYRPTGAIAAAPTTSLPEKLGGTRNWDYRFCWLRDATFTVLTDERRLLPGCFGVARVATACGRGQSPTSSDHVWHDRRAPIAGMGGALARWIRRRQAGPRRQCGLPADPNRRIR